MIDPPFWKLFSFSWLWNSLLLSFLPSSKLLLSAIHWLFFLHLPVNVNIPQHSELLHICSHPDNSLVWTCVGSSWTLLAMPVFHMVDISVSLQICFHEYSKYTHLEMPSSTLKMYHKCIFYPSLLPPPSQPNEHSITYLGYCSCLLTAWFTISIKFQFSQCVSFCFYDAFLPLFSPHPSKCSFLGSFAGWSFSIQPSNNGLFQTSHPVLISPYSTYFR